MYWKVISPTKKPHPKLWCLLICSDLWKWAGSWILQHTYYINPSFAWCFHEHIFLNWLAKAWCSIICYSYATVSPTLEGRSFSFFSVISTPCIKVGCSKFIGPTLFSEWVFCYLIMIVLVSGTGSAWELFNTHLA